MAGFVDPWITRQRVGLWRTCPVPRSSPGYRGRAPDIEVENPDIEVKRPDVEVEHPDALDAGANGLRALTMRFGRHAVHLCTTRRPLDRIS